MKRVLFLFVILSLGVGVVSAASAAQKPIQLKAVQFLNLGNPSEKGFHLFIKNVKEASKGELLIEIVGGPEAIPGRQQPEAVRSGAVDLCYIPCGWYQAICPPAAVMGLSRLNVIEGRKSGLHDFLVEEHKKVGLRFVGANDASGPFNMYCKKPIDNPEKLKGMRFRHSPTYTFFKGMGIIPITARHSDIYPGLERGLFEGLATKLGTFLELSLFEVCSYVIGPDFWPNYSTGTIMNEAKYESLPEHLQQVIQEAELKTEANVGEVMRPLVEGWWKTAEEKGMSRINWSATDTKNFLDKMDSLTWEERAKKLPPGMAEKMKGMMGF